MFKKMSAALLIASMLTVPALAAGNVRKADPAPVTKSATIDAKAATIGDEAFAFIGSAAFSAEGQLRTFVSGGFTYVQLNTQGTTIAEATILLSGTLALTAGEFVL